jgi:hypothetical protein
MLTKKNSILAGVFSVAVISLTLTGLQSNEANSMHAGSVNSAKSEPSEMISWVCAKPNYDVVIVSVEKSRAQKRNGEWFLPGCY